MHAYATSSFPFLQFTATTTYPPIEAQKLTPTLGYYNVAVVGLSIVAMKSATQKRTGIARVNERSQFLANVNSCSRSLYAVARASVVCLSSVTLVHPTQPVEIFSNFSTLFGTLAIHYHPPKILRRSSQGNPSVWGVKHEG